MVMRFVDLEFDQARLNWNLPNILLTRDLSRKPLPISDQVTDKLFGIRRMLGVWLHSMAMSKITLRPATQLDARIWPLRGSRMSTNTGDNTMA